VREELHHVDRFDSDSRVPPLFRRLRPFLWILVMRARIAVEITRQGAAGRRADRQMDPAAVRAFMNENPRPMRRGGKRINGDVVMMMGSENGRLIRGTPVMVAPSVMFATEDHLTTCKWWH
jgi:hypothetical protein